MGNRYSEAEERFLIRFLTNPYGRVSVFRNVPELVAGAIITRYSRSSLLARELLLKEFTQKDKNGRISFRHHRAADFFRRIFAGYGDESVAEEVARHLIVEGVSQVVVKDVEDERIGLSPIEGSTRYRNFSKPDELGRYRYYRPKELETADPALSAEYNEVLDFGFDAYRDLHEPVAARLKILYPRAQQEDPTAWEQAIKGKTEDLLRLLLPLASLTNVGFLANARTLEKFIVEHRGNPNPEIAGIAEEVHRELRKVIPSLLERLDRPAGQAWTEYYWARYRALHELRLNGQPETTSELPRVRVVESNTGDETSVLAGILSEGGVIPDFEEALRFVAERKHTSELGDALVLVLAQLRGSRTQGTGARQWKPPRAFELSKVTVQFCANWGVYKDLQRHRIPTQWRQRFGPNYGYDTPQFVIDLAEENPEIGRRWVAAMERPLELYRKFLVSPFPYLAEYVLPHGYRLVWQMSANIREWTWICELRSIEQGHPDYRDVVQQLSRQLEGLQPILWKIATHINYDQYDLERRTASQREAVKLKKIGARIELPD